MAYILSKLKKITYQPSEVDFAMFSSINAYIENYNSEGQLWNTCLPPINIDLLTFDFTELSSSSFDILICINMIHISPFECTEKLFELASKVLSSHGVLYTYGPYCIDGVIDNMTESNISFHNSLKQRNPAWGIRSLIDILEIARRNNFYLDKKISMPANNFSLIFKRGFNDNADFNSNI